MEIYNKLPKDIQIYIINDYHHPAIFKYNRVLDQLKDFFFIIKKMNFIGYNGGVLLSCPFNLKCSLYVTNRWSIEHKNNHINNISSYDIKRFIDEIYI